LFFLLIAVVAKWRTPMGSKFVTEKTCEATTDGMKIQLIDIKGDIGKLFEKLDSYGKLSAKIDVLTNLLKEGTQ